MIFDPENPVNKRCAEGILLEGSDFEQASMLYQQAWHETKTAAEKATAAHYLARVQADAAAKLTWDRIALEQGLKISDETAKAAFLPSLYLNVGKGLEDLGEHPEARQAYEKGLHYAGFLPEDGYVKLIKNGLKNGLERV